MEVTYTHMAQPSGGIALPELMKLLRAELHAHGHTVNTSGIHVLKLLGEHSLLPLLLMKKLLLSDSGHLRAWVVNIDYVNELSQFHEISPRFSFPFHLHCCCKCCCCWNICCCCAGLS